MKLYDVIFENKATKVTTLSHRRGNSKAEVKAEVLQEMKEVKNHPLRIKEIKLTVCGENNNQ